MNKKILVVAAHPDDEVLGCGGTLYKFSKLGYKINILFLSNGVSARNIVNKKMQKNISLRRKSAQNAGKILGINKIDFFDLPDNKFDSVPLLRIIKLIEQSIKEHDPSIIFTHYDNDLNIDHKITSQATITATRPYLNSSLKKLLLFEVLSSSEWNFGTSSKSFSPNYFVNIEKEIKIKQKAMKCYNQELRKWPHPRSLEGIKNLAKIRGSISGLKFAESFISIREIFD